MGNPIQQAITGTIAAAAGGLVSAKKLAEKESGKAEKALQAQTKEAKQEAREEELHKLEIKGLRAENRMKGYQARTAKVELEMARAKARESLEVAREQAKNKSFKKSVLERINAKRKVRK